ncbi:MAG: DUF488 family protein [Desulfovibrio desulfuricans]|nr:DUF488 family protein [Desulfovibrio desulfuricans]
MRILVDWIWPRDIDKKDAVRDWWCNDAAPSAELGKWFGHDCTRRDELRKRYFAERDLSPQGVKRLWRITDVFPYVESFYVKKYEM